ncbi:MAG: hypothetical protein QNL51_08670 [Opitutaceae bacterium]|tara:strand:+ start:10800 stop:11264 length:465 start_codon:yes stop_codon:yes gene_type:complete
MMKESFSPQEFARLLELVHLGMRTVMSRQGGESPYLERYAGIEQKILSMAGKYGCSDKVDVGGTGKLIPSAKTDEDKELRKMVGEADNDLFWHELVARLGDRDLGVEQTTAALVGKPGPPINADVRLKEIEETYWAEFEKHDLARVLVLRAAQG